MKIALLLVSMLAIGCTETKTRIKSSEIDDSAVTNPHDYNTYEPRVSGCEVSLFFDQKTGRIISIMYKGRSYVPIGERDSLLQILKTSQAQNKKKRPVINQKKNTNISIDNINNIVHINGVDQEVIEYSDGKKILRTVAWVNSDWAIELVASSPGSGRSGNYYWVEEITDSIKRAHRAYADEVYLKKRKGR